MAGHLVSGGAAPIKARAMRLNVHWHSGADWVVQLVDLRLYVEFGLYCSGGFCGCGVRRST